MTARVLTLSLILCFFVGSKHSFSQTNYPTNTSNSRFYTDYYSSKIVRPALSVRGFDSNTQWQSTVADGYGFGQTKKLK